jgi:hypothetical protein
MEHDQQAEMSVTAMHVALGIVRRRLESSHADPADLLGLHMETAMAAIEIASQFGPEGLGALLYELGELAADDFRRSPTPIADLDAIQDQLIRGAGLDNDLDSDPNDN